MRLLALFRSLLCIAAGCEAVKDVKSSHFPAVKFRGLKHSFKVIPYKVRNNNK